MYNKYILNGEGSDEDFGDLFEGIPCNYIPIDIFAIYGANDGFKTWALYQFQKNILERIIREQITESSTMYLEILRCLLLMFVWIWSSEV